MCIVDLNARMVGQIGLSYLVMRKIKLNIVCRLIPSFNNEMC